MEIKRYSPKVDRYYIGIAILANLLVVVPTLIVSFFDVSGLYILIFTLLFVNYFIFSPFFGYVELREDAVFVKYGVFLKRTIPYSKIRGVALDRKWYSESMLSLKCAIDHVNIKYEGYNVTSVSVKDNGAFIYALNECIAASR